MMKKMCETLKATSKARKIIKEFKPDVVIGAGGYICGLDTKMWDRCYYSGADAP